MNNYLLSVGIVLFLWSVYVGSVLIFLIMSTSKEFGKIRQIIFPVHMHELRKVLPLFCLFMFIALTYFVLRSLKDMLILSYTKQVETLSFIKVYVVMPFMILLTLFYGKLSNLGRNSRFIIMMCYFLIVIGSCYYLFLPNIEAIKLDSFADKFNSLLPGMRPLWEAVRFWPATLIYLNAEAWGTMALGVLFWSFCNEIISFNDSKRIYSYLGLGAAVGTSLAGFIIKDFVGKDFNKGVGFSLIFISMVLGIYYYITLDSKRVPELYKVESKAPKKTKIKMSFMDSFKFLLQSKHLALIATLVLCYGAFMSLFEAILKAQSVRLAEKIGNESLSQIYGYQGIANGGLSILFVLMAGWISKKSWKFKAFITPFIATVCTVLFVIFLFAGDGVAILFGGGDSNSVIDPIKILWMTVIFGIVNQVTIKAAKYIMFDATKEQAYIPLDSETKLKGKAAVDGVGSRLGKSFGSFLISAPYIGLYNIFGSINSEGAKISICIIIGLILFFWLRAVIKLSSLLEKE